MGKIADISHYQGNIDWSAARKELDFVIFRASVGSNADKKYLEYTAECGLPYGAYHYVKAGTAEDARTEARFFVECAHKAAKRPLFYIADIEYEAQTETTTEPVCVAFLEELRSLLGDSVKIGLYINRKYKWAGAAIGMCDIMWIPHWGKNDGNVPEEKYQPDYYCDIWQYTSEGTLAGVKGEVDLNMLLGNKPLEYFTGKDGEPKMIYDPKKVIAIARAEVGYLEKNSNSQLDDKTANAGSKNYTKYNLDMKAWAGSANLTDQWCQNFADWCFVKAYGLEAAKALLGVFTNYTPTGSNAFKKRGTYTKRGSQASVR